MADKEEAAKKVEELRLEVFESAAKGESNGLLESELLHQTMIGSSMDEDRMCRQIITLLESKDQFGLLNYRAVHETYQGNIEKASLDILEWMASAFGTPAMSWPVVRFVGEFNSICGGHRNPSRIIRL